MQLHPAIVDFPIALLLTSAAFAVVSVFIKKELFKEIVFWNLLLGFVTAVIAVLTGLWEERRLVHNQEIHEILIKHKFNGIFISIVFFILLGWFWLRKISMGKKEYWVWMTGLLIGAGMVVYQGFLGGKMVFKEGAGVKPMEPILQIQEENSPSHSHGKSGEDGSHLHGNRISDSLPAKAGPHHEHKQETTKPVIPKKQNDSTPAEKRAKQLKD